MHRLATELKSAVEKSGYTRAEICEKCAIEPAALSKYLNGKMHPRKSVLARLVKIVPKSSIGKLYAAYLLDSLPDGSEQYVSILDHTSEENGQSLKEEQAIYHAGKNLPQELEEAFEFLRKMAGKSTAVADSILSTYKLMKGVDLDNL